MSERVQAPEFRFPGILTWCVGVAVMALVGAWLRSFAQAGNSVSIFDLTTFVVSSVLYTELFVMVGVWIWSRSLRISTKQAMTLIWPWLWLLLAPGILEFGLRLFGLSVTPFPFLNILDIPLAIISAGFLPHALASGGTLLTIVCATLGIYWTIFKWQTDRFRALAFAAAFLAAAVLLLCVPSFVGMLGLDREVTLLSAGMYAVQRGLISLSDQSFWWTDVYRRFPAAIGGETEISAQFFLSSLAYLALVSSLFFWIKRELKWTLNQARAWFTLDGFGWSSLLLAFGLSLAIAQHVEFRVGIVNMVAILVLATVWLSAWSYALIRRDIACLSDDERLQNPRPLVMGIASVQKFEEYAILALVASLFGSWLLGWPLFVGIGTFLLLNEVSQSTAVRGRALFLMNGFLYGLIDLSVILVGWFFGAQQASLVLPPSGFLGFWLLLSVLVAIHMLTTSAAPIEDKLIFGRFHLKNMRLWAVILLLAYVLLPLLTEWWSWLWFSLPVGLASALFLSSQTPQTRRVRQLAMLFWVISFFYLAVRVFRS